MTYVWEMNKANTPDLHIRDLVDLNTEWSMFSYLKREFDNIFPRLIDEMDGDIAIFKMGKMRLGFARQTLTKVAKGPRRNKKHQ